MEADPRHPPFKSRPQAKRSAPPPSRASPVPLPPPQPRRHPGRGGGPQVYDPLGQRVPGEEVEDPVEDAPPPVGLGVVVGGGVGEGGADLDGLEDPPDDEDDKAKVDGGLGGGIGVFVFVGCLWSVVGGVWLVECGWWSVVGGVWLVECGWFTFESSST